MIPVNRKVGKFGIIRKIARGGMADVYLGREEDSGRTVALKLIEHSSDPDTVESIAAERRGSALQSRLAAIDQRVVQIYDTGDVDEYFYVAMEYIEGQDLSEIIAHGPLPVNQAVEIAIAICESLEHAHNLQVSIDGKAYHGIVHGDIKPRNIRIDSQGSVRLLDFGIAKALTLSRRLTRNEFGSLQYASPERLDTGEVNWMCDLWSAGVVLYEMVTGLSPYHAESTVQLERMIRSRIPPPLPPETCPEPLRRIIVKSLAPQPAGRYQSAANFTHDLRSFRVGQAVSPAAEETRRTVRADFGNSIATRRTVKPSPQIQPSVSPAKKKRGIGSMILRTLGLLFIGGLIYGGYLGASTYALWKEGQEFENQIKSETLTDPDQIWAKWAKLSQGHPSSLLLEGPQHAVQQKLVSTANAVIATYRDNESQIVNEKDWEKARSYLALALTLYPGDESVRGKLRLCEGHLARITGTARRNTVLLNQAAEKFKEAQLLLPDSPDPQLGLARLYVYGLRDIDRADAALKQAEHLGYRLGNRERAQLADGYRDRADRLWRDAKTIRGLPQEKEQLKNVEEDYNRALQLYQNIAPFGAATANIARVQDSLEEVRHRQHQLRSWFRKLWP